MNEVHQFYGNKLRVRICGLCKHNDQLLLVNHREISVTDFWAPPGGGLNFGEQAEDCLRREFMEETGIDAEPAEFLFACEFIRSPLHSIELFFEVISRSTEIRKGSDPEKGAPSIISSVAFMSWDDIKSLPQNQIHGIFRFIDHPSKVFDLRGYFKL